MDVRWWATPKTTPTASPASSWCRRTRAQTLRASTSTGAASSPSPPGNRPRCWRRKGLRLGVELGVDLDAHVVADKHATGFQGLVPDQAEVLPVHLRRGRDSSAELASHALHLGGNFSGEHRRLADPVNGEDALNGQLSALTGRDFGRLEGDGRVLHHVEEVRRLQVTVPL